MDESETATPESAKIGFPLPAGDAKLVTGLSTILVASIQDAKDRISQIEYVFCSQLYPSFQSDTEAKRRRIEQLEREVHESAALHESLAELVRSKESSLRDAEERRNAAFSKLEICESEKAVLMARIEELDEKLRTKGREIEEAELKRVEEEGKVLERVESLTCELQAERTKRNRVTEAYKRLKSQHVYLRRKIGLGDENVIQQNKSESGSEFGTRQSPIIEPGIAFENPNMTMGACEAAEVRSEIPEGDFGGLEKKTPNVFVAAYDINEVEEKASEDDSVANLSSPSSGFRDVPKCPSSIKSSTKRPASSWRQTRSHQSRAGPDPHDDFLDTPLENIRENLNKEDRPSLIQKDISVDSSDDETQDMNAKSSPQKKQKQSSITVAGKRSFKYVEPVRKKAERENLKGVECKQCRKFYDAVLPNADGKDAGSSKQNLRCEHLDGVSRHRYRYVPPMTPEGFWNIGFESEM